VGAAHSEESTGWSTSQFDKTVYLFAQNFPVSLRNTIGCGDLRDSSFFEIIVNWGEFQWPGLAKKSWAFV